VENVTFQRDRSASTLISIRRLVIRGSLGGLLGHHVDLVRAEGMHVILARSDFSGNKSSPNQTTVDKFVADDAVLEVRQHRQTQPLRFVFQRFRIDNMGGSGATKFAAAFDNPMPAGLIRTSGQFGPWNSSDPASTPVSGTYSLVNADLAVFNSIGGVVSSDGAFKGSFRQMQVEGSTTTPDFEVAYTHHKLPLQTQFSAVVNAINGQTVLRSVKANFGRDVIDAHGTIGRGPDGKRAAIIDLNCDRGRIEDTFYPFIHSPRSPITGNVAFQMHVVIPSGHERFLKKLDLKSDFRIQDARFTNPQTESRLSKIAERPDQKQPDGTNLADLRGRVTVLNGIAQFAQLSARDGDASALLRGSYDLSNEQVNMHGNLTTEASLTKTTSGIKAVFAKAIEPLFKKGPHRKVVPVKISGTFHHPIFGLDMNSNM
jgi:AsmA-like C-terminal region